MELITGGKTLTKVKIQRGIFQGDALSPLLFVIAMLPFSHIVRKCTGATNLPGWDETQGQFWVLYHHHHHHHHVMLQVRISLTLFRHFSLSFIAFWQVFRAISRISYSCCMYVRAGRPIFAWPYAGVHRSTSLMSSSLFLQQYPACLVRLTCIVFVTEGSWPYS